MLLLYKVSMDAHAFIIIIIIIILISMKSLSSHDLDGTSDKTALPHPLRPCRGREGYLGVEEFWHHSCMKCYYYKKLPSVKETMNWLENDAGFSNDSSNSSSPVYFSFEDDLHLFQVLRANFMKDSLPKNKSESIDWKMFFVRQLCEKLKFAKKVCLEWRRCCRSAYNCCQKMKKTPVIAGQCPMTWDGYDCWDGAEANSTSTKSCPASIGMVHPEGRSSKTCNHNATWFKSRGQEWTNYSGCLKFDENIRRVIIEMSFDAISLLLLVPSILIFLSFRELRKQFRIRIHLNFFVALLLCSFNSLLYHIFVHYDIIRSSITGETVIDRNPAWCKMLTTLKIYFNSSTYFWMFCEAVYLHSLLIAAFHKDHSIVNYVILGWMLPVTTCVSYALLRYFHMNEECWSEAHGLYEWIIFAPNIACLLLNLIFLINIVRIIIFKLRPLPQESSNFKKGLRAAAMLVPLFGLHILMTIYRADSYAHLDSESDGGDDDYDDENSLGVRSYYVATSYNHVASAILHSEGIFVSLIFCYLSDEVIGHFRKLKDSCLRKRDGRRTHSTQNISLTSDLKTRGESVTSKHNISK